MDSPERYGLVSRALHWGMAYLLIWQFFTILTWRVFGPAEWVKFVTSFGPYHGTVGLLVLPLVVIRAVWVLVNRKRRPPHETGWPCRVGRSCNALSADVRHSGAGASSHPWQRQGLATVDTSHRPRNRVAHGSSQRAAQSLVVVPVGDDSRTYPCGALSPIHSQGPHPCPHGRPATLPFADLSNIFIQAERNRKCCIRPS